MNSLQITFLILIHNKITIAKAYIQNNKGDYACASLEVKIKNQKQQT